MSLLKNSILTLDSSRGRLIGRRFHLPHARLLIAGLALVAALAAVGCTSGSYPVDIFYEQHYQQSYKSHEPPRLVWRGRGSCLLPCRRRIRRTTRGRTSTMSTAQMCHGTDAQRDDAASCCS